MTLKQAIEQLKQFWYSSTLGIKSSQNHKYNGSKRK